MQNHVYEQHFHEVYLRFCQNFMRNTGWSKNSPVIKGWGGGIINNLKKNNFHKLNIVTSPQHNSSSYIFPLYRYTLMTFYDHKNIERFDFFLTNYGFVKLKKINALEIPCSLCLLMHMTPTVTKSLQPCSRETLFSCKNIYQTLALQKMYTRRQYYRKCILDTSIIEIISETTWRLLAGQGKSEPVKHLALNIRRIKQMFKQKWIYTLVCGVNSREEVIQITRGLVSNKNHEQKKTGSYRLRLDVIEESSDCLGRIKIAPSVLDKCVMKPVPPSAPSLNTLKRTIMEGMVPVNQRRRWMRTVSYIINILNTTLTEAIILTSQTDWLSVQQKDRPQKMIKDKKFVLKRSTTTQV